MRHVLLDLSVARVEGDHGPENDQVLAHISVDEDLRVKMRWLSSVPVVPAT